MVISIVSRGLRSVFYLSIWTVVSLYFLNTHLDKIRLVFYPPEYSTLHAKATTIAVFDRPGENGAPYYLRDNVSQEIRQLIAKGWARNGFNQYVSDLISVHRSLPDFRHEWCKARDRFLPERLLTTTSIIICFHDEAWSTLLRTVHSVLERSPPALVKEIILVDDFSQLPHCQLQLQEYMAQYAKVRIVRTTKRQGLIRARLVGARHAKAPVLTFLDAHCEVTAGWLEPLLDRIARNPRTVVSPVIDGIHGYSFEYRWTETTNVLVGSFDWHLHFIWDAPKRVRNAYNNSFSIHSPTIAGGIFSIDKSFFEHVGTFDSELTFWGSDIIELSFKVWMCGGTVEVIPCSHIGRIHHPLLPYNWHPGQEHVQNNNGRIAEVWLDNYAQHYYDRAKKGPGSFGNVSTRHELRRSLECKSFQWYLNTIYPELFVPEAPVAMGKISNVGSGSCIDGSSKSQYFRKPLRLTPCNRQKGTQYWALTFKGEVRRNNACLDYLNSVIVLDYCNGRKGNQLWEYDNHTLRMKHVASDRCLAVSEDMLTLQMLKCNADDISQKWKVSDYGTSFL